MDALNCNNVKLISGFADILIILRLIKSNLHHSNSMQLNSVSIENNYISIILLLSNTIIASIKTI